MTALSDADRIKSLVEIASRAIAAENAALDRRMAQSDFNEIHSETGTRPSREKLTKMERVEQVCARELRSAIYRYASAVDAEAARKAGAEPVAEDNREFNAQLLALHLP